MNKEATVPRQKFTRRRFLGTLAATTGLTSVMVAAAGCQSVQQALGPKSGGSGSGPVTLRYMSHFTAVGDTARDRAQKQIEEKFKAQNPNVNIQWEQTAWETIGEKYMAAWSANTAPDISMFSPANITQAVRLGSLEDLQPSFGKWAAKDRDDLSKAWWDTGLYEGKKYIAPLLLFGDMIVYRKSMFDAVGANVNEIRTWKQFTETCQNIVKDGQGRNPTQSGFDESTVSVWGWHQFMSRGSGATLPRFDLLSYDRLGRPDLGPPDWRADHWTSPEIIEAVQMSVDWILKDKIAPRSMLTYNLEDADNKFVSGLSAAYQFGTHRYGSWREKMQFPPEDAVFARYPDLGRQALGSGPDQPLVDGRLQPFREQGRGDRHDGLLDGRGRRHDHGRRRRPAAEACERDRQPALRPAGSLLRQAVRPGPRGSGRHRC
jgi:ABC-type glycerol-3-phosphate transport system substrate-binding protein